LSGQPRPKKTIRVPKKRLDGKKNLRKHLFKRCPPPNKSRRATSKANKHSLLVAHANSKRFTFNEDSSTLFAEQRVSKLDPVTRRNPAREVNVTLRQFHVFIQCLARHSQELSNAFSRDFVGVHSKTL